MTGLSYTRSVDAAPDSFDDHGQLNLMPSANIITTKHSTLFLRSKMPDHGLAYPCISWQLEPGGWDVSLQANIQQTALSVQACCYIGPASCILNVLPERAAGDQMCPCLLLGRDYTLC